MPLLLVNLRCTFPHPSYFIKAEGIPRKNYEVYFDKFVPIHPWGNLKLEISKLCHVTHKEEAQIIRRTNCFKPNKKLGKSDGCNGGRSYRNIPTRPSESDEMECDDQPTGGVEEANEYMYERISPREEMFPGFYSWWGLYVEKPIPGLPDPPNYLQVPPDSIYGTTAFIIPLDEILESYASSRSLRLHDLCLRVGGTMRYKREIGYVIIVCTQADEDLFRYDLITSSDAPDLLDVEGFIDGKGTIEDKRHFPSFTTRYYNQSASHETLSFAFYFPKKQNFTCQVNNVKDVNHTGCIHRREMYSYYDRKTGEFKPYEICPDKIADKHRKKHEKALDEYYQN